MSCLRRQLSSICGWIFLFSSFELYSEVNQNNDVQFWLTNSLLKVLNSRSSLYLANEWRFGNEISKFYYVYLEADLRFKAAEKIDIAPGYRQNWDRKKNGWRIEYEPMFQIYFHSKNMIQLRNRMSYIIRQAADPIWQYRGRLRIHFVDSKITPFVSNEVFVRSHEGFCQDRAIIGVNFPLFSESRADFYYMLRFLKSTARWTRQHIFGFWGSFEF